MDYFDEKITLVIMKNMLGSKPETKVNMRHHTTLSSKHKWMSLRGSQLINNNQTNESKICESKIISYKQQEFIILSFMT